MIPRTSPLLALALLAACGSDSSGDGAGGEAPDAVPDGAASGPSVPDAAGSGTAPPEGADAADPERRFLADNAARDGVTVTASGLHYEVLRAADGPRPGADAVVTVHYAGTLIDGTEFDSSYARGEPSTFPLRGVIEGFSEGLQLMGVGSRYRFVMPAEIAYGDAGAGSDIGPGATLVFDVELLEIGSS